MLSSAAKQLAGELVPINDVDAHLPQPHPRQRRQASPAKGSVKADQQRRFWRQEGAPRLADRSSRGHALSAGGFREIGTIATQVSVAR
jgi:hypothetical protein